MHSRSVSYALVSTDVVAGYVVCRACHSMLHRNLKTPWWRRPRACTCLAAPQRYARARCFCVAPVFAVAAVAASMHAVPCIFPLPMLGFAVGFQSQSQSGLHHAHHYIIIVPSWPACTACMSSGARVHTYAAPASARVRLCYNRHTHAVNTSAHSYANG